MLISKYNSRVISKMDFILYPNKKSMPLIKIQTSVKELKSAASILKKLSSKTAEILSKPESYVMTSIGNNVDMTFAGSDEPSCYVEVKSIGALDPQNISAISESICSTIEKEIGVAANRTYIHFEDVPAKRWGWNKKTFG